jgi:hypothetical protein
MGEKIMKFDFIQAFTQRENPEPMSNEELLRRLDTTLQAMNEAEGHNEPRLATSVVDCLRGAVIRLSQANGDESVLAKAQEIVRRSIEIIGV